MMIQTKIYGKIKEEIQKKIKCWVKMKIGIPYEKLIKLGKNKIGRTDNCLVSFICDYYFQKKKKSRAKFNLRFCLASRG